MITPALQDDAFLADVAAASARPDAFSLWWLGQSGFLVKWAARHLLIDPSLSDALTRKYAATDKPHVPLGRRVVDPARLDFIDVVTSSHNHTDHLDADTLLPLLAARPQLTLIAPEANRAVVAQRLGIPPGRLTGVVAHQPVAVTDWLTVTGIPAAHNALDTDARGHHLYLGYVFRFGPFSLYHSGDTLLNEHLPRVRADLALLPINGDRPERRVAGNLTGREAAQLAKSIGAKLVIPCHYDMFAFNTAHPEAEFVPECQRLGQPHRVLRLGERLAWPAEAPQ